MVVKYSVKTKSTGIVFFLWEWKDKNKKNFTQRRKFTVQNVARQLLNDNATLLANLGQNEWELNIYPDVFFLKLLFYALQRKRLINLH